MSRTFNGTTDLINLGSPAALDDIGGVNGPRSLWAWIYPTGWGEGSLGRIWDKATGTTSGTIFFVDDVGGGSNPNAGMAASIGGSSRTYAYSASSVLSLNARWFVAVTWKGTIGTNLPRLFRGSASSPVAEVEYMLTNLGSGYGSDAADTAYIGNNGGASRTFNGSIAHLGVADQALSVAQLDMLRLFPYAPMHRFSTGGTVINLKGYWPLNESAAATCLDHSGNGSHGTVTGTSVAAEPPFAWTRRGVRATIWTPTAAAGVTYPQLERSRRGLERGVFIGAAN